jgi:hypothetical protein
MFSKCCAIKEISISRNFAFDSCNPSGFLFWNSANSDAGKVVGKGILVRP